ncbi:MAG: NfeD family protein [Candidatus Hydrogenedentota bacterium]
MARYISSCCLAIVALAVLAPGIRAAGNTAPLATDTGEPGGGAPVFVCPVRDEMGLGSAAVVKRAVEEAQEAEARAFVLLVDTPGGRVDAALDIAEALMELTIPTYAYIEKTGAISAGALISFACDTVYMAPATSIGAATPFMPGVETSEDIDEKSMSFVRSRFRAYAEENGHDPLIGEAMADRSIGVYGWTDATGDYVTARAELDDEGNAVRPDDVPEKAALLSSPGKLLTLTTDEAIEVQLAAGKFGTLDAALAEHNLSAAPRRTIEANWSERLFAFLTNPIINGLLLMLGLGGLYIEIRTPGFGLPGMIGVGCLALFFGANAVLGLADWVDVALVVLGIGLLLVEAFVLPGFGIAGVSGIICVAAGLFLSLTRVPIPEYSWDYQRLEEAMLTIGVMVISFTGFVIGTWYVFPRSPFFRWLVLTDAHEEAGGYIVQTQQDEQSAIGLRGETTSVLRPAGRGRFGGTTMDIVTRGEYIDPGRPVEIIEVAGNRYVVTEIKEEQA